MATASDLVAPFLDALGQGFVLAAAPDGTPVLSTPFRFFTGDPVEIAWWEEEGALHLSDRGGLVQSLLLKGLDVLEPGPNRERLQGLLQTQGLRLHGGAIVASATRERLGSDIEGLMQALMDGQVAVRESAAAQVAGEPVIYNAVRRTLDASGARYREGMRITGHLGRRYTVDFELAFRTEDIIRAIMVVATDRTLEMAERWNFRFHDIRRARPALHRLFLVAEDATWSDDAHRTIVEACEQVIAPGEQDALSEYLRTARRIA